MFIASALRGLSTLAFRADLDGSPGRRTFFQGGARGISGAASAAMKRRILRRVARLHSRPLRNSWTRVGSFSARWPNAVAVMFVAERNRSTSARIGSGSSFIRSMAPDCK